MDSSGVRGQGLKTRDERDQIPMRRKIRGLYSGAGKGDIRRLELNVIREEDGDENIIERTNHATSLRLVSGIINLAKNEWISKDTAHPYPAKYSDEHESLPIFEVDSHQTDANGKKGKRYTELTPCKLFVDDRKRLCQGSRNAGKCPLPSALPCILL